MTEQPEFDLSGKTAMVTGAGRGLGKAFALALARYGADVAICSRTTAEIEQTAAEIEDLGRRVYFQAVDVTNRAAVESWVQSCRREFGRVDILVNNAGINIPQWALDVTEEAWDSIIEVNQKAVFFVAQAVGRIMKDQRSGKIINVSSDAGAVGLPRRAAYCASKGAVNQLTKVLAIEWARYNINVNAIAPAFIETPFTEPMFQEPEFRDYVLGHTPLGRVGETRDVVGAVILLASPASDYITGHILHIDGGWTAH